MGENPFNSFVANNYSIPYLGDVFYPSKWWLPNFEQDLKFVKKFYCNDRYNLSSSERQFEMFFRRNQDNSILLVYGECGV